MSTSSILHLVREDLRAFAGYSSARTSALQGDVWLNANESAWGNPA
ncbi:histidinol-phosphate transaminase, partial [Xanthomonas oryzae pv. oryzae]